MKPGPILEIVIVGPARRHGFVGIFVSELVKIEFDQLEEGLRFRDRFRRLCEQPRHFRRKLEVAFGIYLEQAAGLLDFQPFADAGHYVLQVALSGRMIEGVVGRDQRRVCL
jgi:hypothetical protein